VTWALEARRVQGKWGCVEGTGASVGNARRFLASIEYDVGEMTFQQGRRRRAGSESPMKKAEWHSSFQRRPVYKEKGIGSGGTK